MFHSVEGMFHLIIFQLVAKCGSSSQVFGRGEPRLLIPGSNSARKKNLNCQWYNSLHAASVVLLSRFDRQNYSPGLWA